MIRGQGLILKITSAEWTSNSLINSPILTAPFYLSDLTPDIPIQLASPEISDIITLRRSTDDFASYTEASDTITSLVPVNVLEFDFGGNWTVTTWKVKGYVTRNGENSPFGNTISFTLDTTGPVLSSPTDAATGVASGTGTVSTNDGSGILYWVASTSATPPSAAQVKAGQNHLGAAAINGSQAVSTAGVQNISIESLTGLTQYYTHYMQDDAYANPSAVVSADGFITDDPASYIPNYYIYLF